MAALVAQWLHGEQEALVVVYQLIRTEEDPSIARIQSGTPEESTA